MFGTIDYETKVCLYKQMFFSLFMQLGARVRGEAKVVLARGHLNLLKALGELGGCLLVRESGDNHALVAGGPVGRSGDRVLGGELKRVNNANDLVKVAASGGGVEDAEGELASRVGQVHGTSSEGDSGLVKFIRVEHAEGEGDLARLIGNNGEAEVTREVLAGLDVGDPLLVAVNGVAAESSALNTTLLELLEVLGDSAELGGTDRGEVSRVAEKESPGSLEVLAEVNFSLGGVSLDLGKVITETGRALLLSENGFGHGAKRFLLHTKLSSNVTKQYQELVSILLLICLAPTCTPFAIIHLYSPCLAIMQIPSNKMRVTTIL